jgi:hypothetical protein
MRTPVDHYSQANVPSELRNDSVGSLEDLMTPAEREITTRVAYCTSKDCGGHISRVQKFNASKFDATCPDCDHVLYWEVIRAGKKTARRFAERKR